MTRLAKGADPLPTVTPRSVGQVKSGQIWFVTDNLCYP
jgi:hypothetical protein